MDHEISLVLHNIRSTHNVGSIFRTADGFGVKHIFISGYTPYPLEKNDARLPHIAEKQTADIAKTALGAEKTVPFSRAEHVEVLLEAYKKHGYKILGLEQDEKAINIAQFKPTSKMLLILGEEVQGITKELQETCDHLLEIPMKGQKESFNVGVATGIALYVLTS